MWGPLAHNMPRQQRRTQAPKKGSPETKSTDLKARKVLEQASAWHSNVWKLGRQLRLMTTVLTLCVSHKTTTVCPFQEDAIKVSGGIRWTTWNNSSCESVETNWNQHADGKKTSASWLSVPICLNLLKGHPSLVNHFKLTWKVGKLGNWIWECLHKISLTVLPEGPTFARMEHDLLRRHECSASAQVIEQNGHFQNKKLSGWQVAYHTDSQWEKGSARIALNSSPNKRFHDVESCISSCCATCYYTWTGGILPLPPLHFNFILPSLLLLSAFSVSTSIVFRWPLLFQHSFRVLYQWTIFWTNNTCTL